MLNPLCTGKGIPNQLYRRKNLARSVAPSDIPLPQEAVDQFHSGGGQLTLFSPFGTDPLDGDEDLVAERERRLQAGVSNFASVFHSLVNRNDQSFRDGLKLFLRVTQEKPPPLQKISPTLLVKYYTILIPDPCARLFAHSSPPFHAPPYPVRNVRPALFIAAPPPRMRLRPPSRTDLGEVATYLWFQIGGWERDLSLH